MVRMKDLPKPMDAHLAGLPCPTFETQPWVEGPPLNQRRVAIISTAGIHRRGDRPFFLNSDDYRIITGDTENKDMVMTHVSTNFDRSGFQQDWNIAFPLDRLKELAAEGVIGSVADYHYSFMGATEPEKMESVARGLAKLLKGDNVNAVFLVPI